MTEEELRKLLMHRPAVHRLYCGAFIQEVLTLGKDILVVPLKALGFDSQSEYAAQYITDICGGRVDQDSLLALKKQGENALPIFSLVALLSDSQEAPVLEQKAEKLLDGPEKILSWSSGEDFSLFAICTSNAEGSFYRLTPPSSHRRLRLGFGNTGKDYADQILRLVDAEKNDEHFSFALSLFHDAVKEKNQQFKIARFFSCLECLAYKLKSSERPSRKAVKFMLGLEDGAMVENVINGKKYRFDRIEIAGRLRDKLFHGVQFKESDLNAESVYVFELLQDKPDIIASSLQSDCELEIARWANGASKGLRPD